MVSQQASKGSSVKNFIKIFFLFAIVASFTTLVIHVCVNYLPKNEPEPSNIEDPEPEPEPEPEPVIPEINFQPTVDAWVNSIGGNKGVVVFDIEHNKVVGSYNADTKFATASLYKLYVVYHGYRLVQKGEWDRNAIANGRGNTILQCLDAAIRSSDSGCAEPLWSKIGQSHLNDVVNYEFNMMSVTVSSLQATANEIKDMMLMFYYHTEVTDESLVSVMKDSFLNQPTTTYNWRQGLPSGFTTAAKVYNKVGWNYSPDARAWTIYDDAAIVEFPAENRHFVVVVMSSYVPYQQISRFGSEFEAAYHAGINTMSVSGSSDASQD